MGAGKTRAALAEPLQRREIFLFDFLSQLLLTPSPGPDLHVRKDRVFSVEVRVLSRDIQKISDFMKEVACPIIDPAALCVPRRCAEWGRGTGRQK